MKHLKKFNENLELQDSQKWDIFAGLGGGFGGANYIKTITGTESMANSEAYTEAYQIYQSYEGSNGLRSAQDIMDEDGIEDEDEAQQIANEEMESWLDYYVKPHDPSNIE